MERKMNTNGTEMDEPATVEETDTVSPETIRQAHNRLLSIWRFARHLLEMVVAMMIGMAVFGVALWVLGEPPGYANLFMRYGLMGAFMAAPMVGWMRYRGHSWSDGLEMTLAMLVPMLAPVVPVELGVAVPGLSEGSLMTLSHAAMIAGMVALMLYRRDRYTHRDRDQRAGRVIR